MYANNAGMVNWKDLWNIAEPTSFQLTFGARPVKRAMQKLVLNELSKKILAGTIQKDRPIIIDSFGEELVFRN